MSRERQRRNKKLGKRLRAAIRDEGLSFHDECGVYDPVGSMVLKNIAFRKTKPG